MNVKIIIFLVSLGLSSCRNSSFLQKKYTRGVYCDFREGSLKTSISKGKVIPLTKIPIETRLFHPDPEPAEDKAVENIKLAVKLPLKIIPQIHVLKRSATINSSNKHVGKRRNGVFAVSRNAGLSRTLGLFAVITAIVAVYGFPSYILILGLVPIALGILAIVFGTRAFGDGFFSDVAAVFGILCGIVTIALIVFIALVLLGVVM